jgi:predicted ATPase
MKIKKIHLRNFKNFEDVTVALGDMNVLIGANASGKSNFLSALKFLRDIQQFGMEDAVSLQGGIEYIGRFGMKEGDEILIKVDIELDFELNHSRIKIHKDKNATRTKITTVIEYAVYELTINLQQNESYIFEENIIYKSHVVLSDGLNLKNKTLQELAQEYIHLKLK